MAETTQPTALVGKGQNVGLQREKGQAGDRLVAIAVRDLPRAVASKINFNGVTARLVLRSEGKRGSMDNLRKRNVLTPEDRARAQEARRAKAAARRTSALRRDFTEARWWLRLASARGLTLPPWGEPATTGAMETWLRKCGMSVPQYFRLSGFNSLGSWIRDNPGWPLRAWAGVCLEWEARNG